MPAPRSPEFRRQAVELGRQRDKPIAQIAKDLGIAESGLRRWMAQADVDQGTRERLSTTARACATQARRACALSRSATTSRTDRAALSKMTSKRP